MRAALLAVVCSLAGGVVGVAYVHRTAPVVSAPDAGAQPHLATKLRRDPLRLCWFEVAPSGNASPEECVTDGALHRLEQGLPIDHEPVYAIWDRHRMALVDGGPVLSADLTWRDAPVRLCWRSRNQVTGEATTEQCRTKIELLGLLESNDAKVEIPRNESRNGRL